MQICCLGSSITQLASQRLPLRCNSERRLHVCCVVLPLGLVDTVHQACPDAVQAWLAVSRWYLQGYNAVALQHPVVSKLNLCIFSRQATYVLQRLQEYTSISRSRQHLL